MTIDKIRADIERLHYHPKLDFIKNDEVVDMALEIIDKCTKQEPTTLQQIIKKHNMANLAYDEMSDFERDILKYAEQSGWEEMTVPCENCGHDMTFKIATIGEPCEDCKYKSIAEQEPTDEWQNGYDMAWEEAKVFYEKEEPTNPCDLCRFDYMDGVCGDCPAMTKAEWE